MQRYSNLSSLATLYTASLGRLAHVTPRHWKLRREDKQHRCQGNIAQTDLQSSAMSTIEVEIHTISVTHPKAIGSFHRRSGSVRRPRRQLTPMGMAYERSRAITAEDIMALKALQPVNITPYLWSRYIR